MKKHGTTLILLLIVSIILVSIGAFLDTEPHYPNIWHTILELIMLTLIVFGVFNIVYWGLHFATKLFKKSA